MKKRIRIRTTGRKRVHATAVGVRMESLEDRRLLANDGFEFILGPGLEPRVTVPAEVILEEGEREEDPRNQRIPNNTVAQAETIGLGFDAGESAAIDIRGSLIEPGSIRTNQSSEIPQPNAVPPIPAIEDSSILLANSANAGRGVPIQFTGSIGDSPGGFTDADYYEFEDVEVGDRITAHLETGNQISMVLYNQFGEVLLTTDALNPTVDGDNFFSFFVQETGDYYIAVVPYTGDSATFVPPTNPFDAGSVQPGGGGAYLLTVGVNATDIDYYAVDLNPGDILGVNAIGSANVLTVFTPDEELAVRSGLRNNFAPADSPLPQGGSANLAYVATTSGRHYVSLEGFMQSRYVMQTRLFRPAIESAPAGTRQILFLDFDGATLNPVTLDDGGTLEPRRLSPMVNFLPRWGLRDEDELIDKIIAVVDRDFNGDLQKINPDAGVEIRNSRDHADPFGQPFVSRVIIGGTQAELTIPTVGVASSVDIGNFDMEETAIVLLDQLAGLKTEPVSLNQFLTAPGSSKADVVAHGVGGIASHEAAHFFGALHVDRDNNVPNIMDTGGDIEAVVGSGDDRIFGTADDVDIPFGFDEFDHNEGFVGFEDSARMLAHVLVSGKGGAIPGATRAFSGVVFADANQNGIRDVGEVGVAGSRVYFDVNGDREFGIREPSAVSDATGRFTISNVPVSGAVTLRIVVTPGQRLVAPLDGHTFDAGSPASGDLNFALSMTTGSQGGTDFGDAPLSYGVASHQILPGFSLGDFIDGEAATLANDGSDDDGVVLTGVVAGATATATITASNGTFSPGVVNGWLDFNGDGVFSSDERIVHDVLVSGTATVEFDVPADADTDGITWSRFRYGYTRGIGPVGTGKVGEVEDYAVQISTTGGGNGNNQGPDAMDDNFTVVQDSPPTTLNVLANDLPGSGTLSIDSAGSGNAGGTVTVAANGQSLQYAPPSNFTGTETFAYTVVTPFGSDTALVEVVVTPEDGGGDNDLIRFRLETTSTDGTPITTIDPESDFVFNVYAQDLRANGIGVFAGYLDVEYDGQLAAPTGDVVFGENYPAGQVPPNRVIVGDPGAFDEFGAFAGITNELGNAEILLYSVPMRTGVGDGILEFTSNPSDILPSHEVLLGDIAQAIPIDRIEYTSTTLTVGGGIAAAFTNPENRFDVDNNGFVTPRDALILINDINALGARTLAAAASPISTGFFLDVSQDGNLTAIDVLQVINWINQANTQANAPVAAAVDAVFDLGDDDDEDEDDFFSRIG